jgi:hypothetical protein
LQLHQLKTEFSTLGLRPDYKNYLGINFITKPIPPAGVEQFGPNRRKIPDVVLRFE